jgi:hypothetical protein
VTAVLLTEVMKHGKCEAFTTVNIWAVIWFVPLRACLQIFGRNVSPPSYIHNHIHDAMSREITFKIVYCVVNRLRP